MLRKYSIITGNFRCTTIALHFIIAVHFVEKVLGAGVGGGIVKCRQVAESCEIEVRAWLLSEKEKKRS